MSTSLPATLKNELCVRPVHLNIEGFEPSFEECEKVLEKVEGVSFNLVVTIIYEYFFGYTDLETFLTIEPENIEDKDDSAHETSNI